MGKCYNEDMSESNIIGPSHDLEMIWKFVQISDLEKIHSNSVTDIIDSYSMNMSRYCFLIFHMKGLYISIWGISSQLATFISVFFQGPALFN